MLLGATTQLKSAVDVLVDEVAAVGDAGAVVPAEAAEALLALESARERLEAVAGVSLVGLEDRGFAEAEAAYSMANWLTSRTGASRARAGSRMFLARKLADMPATQTALLAGEITACHARVLARALNPRTHEVFVRDEAMLVGQAKQLPADLLARAIELWLRYADPDGAVPRVEGENDRFYLSNTSDGRVKGDFDVGGDLAVTVKRAIDELVDQLRRQDVKNREIDPTDPGLDQTPAQRRARALGELCARAAGADENPARRQPLFTVHTTLDTLTQTGDPTDWKLDLEEAWTGAIPTLEARLWACDCWITQIVIRKADGEILHAGRELRTATRAMRRALVARDGPCCAVPGCDRPANWCDAHHIIHWEDGGPTDLDNLTLLCRWHHRLIHTDHLRVQLVHGRPQFTNPAGMTLHNPRGLSEPWSDPPPPDSPSPPDGPSPPDRPPPGAGGTPAEPPGDPPTTHSDDPRRASAA